MASIPPPHTHTMATPVEVLLLEPASDTVTSTGQTDGEKPCSA